jgi:hypothetical protein
LEKPLFYQDNLKRFERFDVEHIVLPSDLFPGINSERSEETLYRQYQNADWARKKWIQENVKFNTEWVCHSDVDEFMPRPPSEDELKDVDYLACGLVQYMAQINRRTTKVATVYRICRSSLTRDQLPAPKSVRRGGISDRGWHFTHLITEPEEMLRKAQCRPWSYGVEKPEDVPGLEYFASLQGQAVSYIDRTPLGNNKIVSLDELPVWMKENSHLFPVATED